MLDLTHIVSQMEIKTLDHMSLMHSCLISEYEYNLNILVPFLYIIMRKNECVLCGNIVQESTSLNLCKECIGCADCCIGLEKL